MIRTRKNKNYTTLFLDSFDIENMKEISNYSKNVEGYKVIRLSSKCKKELSKKYDNPLFLVGNFNNSVFNFGSFVAKVSKIKNDGSLNITFKSYNDVLNKFENTTITQVYKNVNIFYCLHEHIFSYFTNGDLLYF